jgi:hypothetical protein
MTCGRIYKAKRSLWRHQKYECQKEPAFKCPVCPYRAKQKSTVVGHMMSKHQFLNQLKHQSYDCVMLNNK